MRYLSSALLEAQKQSQVQPAVRLIIRDYQALDVRLDWFSLYSGSEPEGPNCAVQVADGSLVRARLEPANGNLYRQRVTDPAQTDQWMAWTYVKGVSGSAQVALAADRADASVFPFFVDPDQRTINEGATYSCGDLSDGTVVPSDAVGVFLMIFARADAQERALGIDSADDTPDDYSSRVRSFECGNHHDAQGTVMVQLGTGDNAGRIKIKAIAGNWTYVYAWPVGYWR